jgi:hypothetical protein
VNSLLSEAEHDGIGEADWYRPSSLGGNQTADSTMLGFKQFETAAITISGIEPLRRKIRKHQFKTGKLTGSTPKTAPEIWAAILAA